MLPFGAVLLFCETFSSLVGTSEYFVIFLPLLFPIVRTLYGSKERTEFNPSFFVYLILSNWLKEKAAEFQTVFLKNEFVCYILK
jgi:hypothetical protein